MTTPSNARSAVELLREIERECSFFAHWTPEPTLAYRDECVRPSMTKALKYIRALEPFLAAEPQQDNDAGAAPRKDAVSPPASTSPASPLQAGEVAALIERLRAWANPALLHVAPLEEDEVLRAADMLARLSKT